MLAVFSLYFLSPTGHSLKALDLATMKHIDSKVNIIPVIARADALSKSELQQFKQTILQELNAAGVKIYRFPTDDEIIAEENRQMNVSPSCFGEFDLFFTRLESPPVGHCCQQ